MEAPHKSTICKSWKEKAKERSKENCRLRQELKRKESQIRHYKLKAKRNKIPHSDSIPFHHYPLLLVTLGVYIYSHCNVSLRATARIINHLSLLLGWPQSNCSHTTVRTWCLRFGLSELQKPLAPGEYAIIAEETIELSKEIGLTLLAVPLDKPLLSERALKYADCQVISLGVQHSWTGEQVAALINQARSAGVRFTYGVIDGGANLIKALGLADIPIVRDCTHILAGATRKVFKKHDAFNAFIVKINQLRAKWVLSKNRPFLPVALRAKSRFHQCFVVADYVEWISEIYEDLSEEQQLELEFIKQGVDMVDLLVKLRQIVTFWGQTFKIYGLGKKSRDAWRSFSSSLVTQEGGYNVEIVSILKVLDEYVNRELSKQLPNTVHCCSDVLESMFGKFKLKKCSMITDDILRIALYPVEITPQKVEQALRDVTCCDVLNWKKKNTVRSMLCQIRDIKKMMPKKTA